MKRALVFLLLLATGVAALACVRAPGGVAPSNIPVAPGSYIELGPVVGDDCKINLLMILPVSGANYTTNAMKEALGQRPGTDALINITVDVVSKAYILWSSTCTEVRGTAIKLK